MRELKFRIWNKEFEKFLPSEEWFLDLNGNIRFIDFSCGNGGDTVYPICEDKNNFIIQQFTGLKDKNGKDIYEGDIIKCSAEQMMSNNTPIQYSDEYCGLIEYNSPSFVITSFDRGDNMKIPIFWLGIEIIGNIFENPELLA